MQTHASTPLHARTRRSVRESLGAPAARYRSTAAHVKEESRLTANGGGGRPAVCLEAQPTALDLSRRAHRRCCQRRHRNAQQQQPGAMTFARPSASFDGGARTPAPSPPTSERLQRGESAQQTLSVLSWPLPPPCPLPSLHLDAESGELRRSSSRSADLFSPPPGAQAEGKLTPPTVSSPAKRIKKRASEPADR